MDALLKRAKRLAAAGSVDHDLTVKDILARRETQLGEVAAEVLAAARLKSELLAGDEYDRAEAVVLLLIGPFRSNGQRGGATGERRLDRELDRHQG